VTHALVGMHHKVAGLRKPLSLKSQCASLSDEMFILLSISPCTADVKRPADDDCGRQLHL
jgi:hypothetical protein